LGLFEFLAFGVARKGKWAPLIRGTPIPNKVKYFMLAGDAEAGSGAG
jgi:hypothetical protein